MPPLSSHSVTRCTSTVSRSESSQAREELTTTYRVTTLLVILSYIPISSVLLFLLSTFGIHLTNS